jgi:transposase
MARSKPKFGRSIPPRRVCLRCRIGWWDVGVAMSRWKRPGSTGVLFGTDGDFNLILANAAHVKNVPGCETDVADALWLADLLAHGLIRTSFVPDPATQEMRALPRTRKQLAREAASHAQRPRKTLEDANIKLASVLTNIVGVSGRDILEALVGGETDPEQLLALLRRGVKAPEKVKASLQGTRHRTSSFPAAPAPASDRCARRRDHRHREGGEPELDPFRQAVRQSRTIPGISDLTAQMIVSEIGIDMTRFPTAGT